MLNMGFIEDIELILSTVPDERQTLLFSATMPDPIRKIAERFMQEPVLVRVKAKEMTVDRIEQYYLELKESEKFDTLARLFDIQTPDLAIVFGRTKRRVDELASALNIRGYMAEGIHGDLSQAKRLSVLKNSKTATSMYSLLLTLLHVDLIFQALLTYTTLISSRSGKLRSPYWTYRTCG